MPPTMTTPQHFHRFPDLPRELQLHIWDLYEAQRPRVRHYFRRMVHIPGCLHGAAPATRPVRTDDVPDDALTPDTKVLLLQRGDYYDFRLPVDGNQYEYISTLDFRHIRCYPMTSSRHHWVNFKLDTFCFTQARRTRSRLDYIEHALAARSVFDPAPRVSDETLLGDPARPFPDEALLERHWFFRVQKLELLVRDVFDDLGDFDKRVLARHPSLKAVTIVPTIRQLMCHHHPSGDLINNPYAMERGIDRITLPETMKLLGTAPATPPCHCDACLVSEDQLTTVLDMQEQLVALFSGQQGRRVDVRIEVEVYWADEKLDIDAVIARAVRKQKEAEEAAREAEAEPQDPQDVSDIDEADP